MPACLSSLSNSLAVCTRKPTSLALVTGKPRSLSPDPPASSSDSLPPESQESDMETVTDLKRKSSDSSPKRAKKRKSNSNEATSSGTFMHDALNLNQPSISYSPIRKKMA